MLHLYDRATMAHALTLNLDPLLHRLLADRIAALQTEVGDLTDDTEYLVITPAISEADIVRAVGFTPLIDPITGAPYGTPGWEPGFDYLVDHGGWFELIATFGSTFAYILLIQDAEGVPADLLALCRGYAGR